MNAYDIDMLARPVDRTSTSNDGWCFGLPPGITSEQWPLDPTNGHPLMHGFTIRLPLEYRVHGPDIVALSFFSIAPDHNDGGAKINEPVAQAFSQETCPSNRDLVPFWRSIRAAHPRLYRMKDILECPYAAILLTQAEFDGELCFPPQLEGNRFLAETPRPKWLEVGAARVFWDSRYNPYWNKPPEEYWLYKELGQIPDTDLAFNRALSLTVRARDPNPGKTPSDDGYEPDWYYDGDQYLQREWAKGLKGCHIGGTMEPWQQAPDFSPFYVEFGESFGGYNFGGGNAQLDFRDMRFDWACG